MANRHWSREEVAATVRFYLDMLELEIHRTPFNKAERNRALREFLDDRSSGAVERKHQNISAVLVAERLPYVDGYKPLGNYQGILAEEVDTQLEQRPELLAALQALVTAEVTDDEAAEALTYDDILRRLVDTPTRPTSTWTDRVREEGNRYARVRKIDYLELEARNRSLGSAGERFVLDFERARLVVAGREDLAHRIEHTSVERGDGAGFDILSYDEGGSGRLIEVKTTRFGGHTPFYVSANEVRVSEQEQQRYHLYRVFRFRERPELFTATGALSDVCELQPSVYRGRVS